MINRLIIKLAFFLHHSKRYKIVKKLFYNLLQNSDYSYKKYFDSFMIILILLSVGILVYEVKHPVSDWVDYFDFYIVSFIFLFEYLARVWVYNDWNREVVSEYSESKFLNRPFSLWRPTKKILKDKLTYLLTPSAIIDLLAILPAYRPLRVLRVFILFRVFKLLRYSKSIRHFMEVLGTKQFELVTLLFLLLFIVFSAGIAIYIFEERANENISSLFDAFYWALITISSVGYGDISPVTTAGRIISMMIIIAGIAMISFVTSVIVSSFSEKLTELKGNRLIENINKYDEFTILCGYGQMSRMFLHNYAKEYGKRYIIIEKDKIKVDRAIKDGYQVICDDASSYELMERFNIKYAKITLLVLTKSDIENVYITLNAKSLSRNIKVLTRATNNRIAKKCKLAGADHVILPNILANKMLLIAITQPVMYNAVYAMLTGKHLAQIDEISLYYHQKLLGKRVIDIDFKGHKLLFIGLESKKEGRFVFNPPRERLIEEDDILLIMGRRGSIEYFKEMYKEIKYV
ncbi:cAMP-dependent Kef-type K+ transport system [hydrothermal vent metagenome]|uniref:BK channel n=1 Tax=hydrothermal vent metagenome TaxID=652676 RepID=A0A1W1C003_9ZZZZ